MQEVTAGSCQDSFPFWKPSPGPCATEITSYTGSQGLTGGGDSLTQGPPCHTLTRLCAGGHGGGHVRPLPEPAWTLIPEEDPTLDPTPNPTPGSTWLGCADRGCLCPGGNTDPKERPTALALYRGEPGLCYWLGGAAPRDRAGRQLSLSPHRPGIVPTRNPGMPCAHPHGLVWAAPGSGPRPPPTPVTTKLVPRPSAESGWRGQLAPRRGHGIVSGNVPGT